MSIFLWLFHVFVYFVRYGVVFLVGCTGFGWLVGVFISFSPLSS